MTGADSDGLVRLKLKAELAEQAPGLLLEALTHPSYTHEHPVSGRDNQRLEFLGDAVLNLVVSREIFSRASAMCEGAMSRARAVVVCERSLAQAASGLGLGQMLRLGKGEEAGGGRTRPSVLADAFEAVVGAMFEHGGLDAASRFVMSALEPVVAGVVSGDPPADPKSALQQMAQRSPGNRLSYVVEREEGPDHAKVFTVAVALNGRVLGRGQGRSKREAEQEAAGHALLTLSASGS